MTQNLANLTPVEIDTVLSKIWGEKQSVEMQISGYRKAEDKLKVKVQQIKRGERVVGYVTAVQGIELMEQLNLVRDNIQRAQGDLRKVLDQATPYEAEYTRRGGWNRVFVATSNNGHAHNGTECSTCHNGEYRTNFVWLIKYSGATEAEIVADAGERACTTCYPSAPADAKGTKMFTPDEEKAAKAREEREAAKAERARQADAKGITTPEGLPLDIGSHGFKDIAKTLRTAEIAATDLLVDLAMEKRHAEDPEWAFRYTNGRTTEKEQAQIAHRAWWILRAIAAKKGQTFEETFQVHEKKAQAKVRKMDRDWAKDFRNPNRVTK